MMLKGKQLRVLRLPVLQDRQPKKPSRQDMEITKQVKDAAQLMRITVLDHLILTDAGYYSFADEGQL